MTSISGLCKTKSGSGSGHADAQATERLPDRVQAVLAQRLFVEKAGLPSALLNQVKRLASLQNPEFYKKQSLRLSTALTPRGSLHVRRTYHSTSRFQKGASSTLKPCCESTRAP